MCASPSRTDEPRRSGDQAFNQNPNPFSANLTTSQDLNGVANQRENRSGSRTGISFQILQDGAGDGGGGLRRPDRDRPPGDMGGDMVKTYPSPMSSSSNSQPSRAPSTAQVESPALDGSADREKSRLEQIKHALITFSQFVGPGFMISVAYSECYSCHITRASVC